MEMRSMLLEAGGKAILVIKWQRTWPFCVHDRMCCVLGFLCFVGLRSDEIGYLPEKIYKPSVKSVAWLKE